MRIVLMILPFALRLVERLLARRSPGPARRPAASRIRSWMPGRRGGRR